MNPAVIVIIFGVVLVVGAIMVMLASLAMQKKAVGNQSQALARQ